MKHALKIIGAAALAAVLFAGGYIAGQHTQISSIIAAMPKRSVDKPPEANESEQNIIPDESMAPMQEPQPDNEIPERSITVTDTSAADETWTVVSETQDDNNEKLTLYTSAEKSDQGIVWDDSQKWVLEVSDPAGGYYTLYDQLVTNGSVFFDVAEKESGDRLVYVYTITASGISVMQYTRTEAGFTEKAVYNSGAVNRIFSSVPNYN